MQISTVGAMIARTLRHGIMPQLITDEAEIAKIRDMAAQYRLWCEMRPFVNRIHLAQTIGTRVYDVNIKALVGPQRKYSEVRQRLMSFTYVIGEGEHKYLAIGRAFNRSHATVMHAVHKYEDAIRELVL